MGRKKNKQLKKTISTCTFINTSQSYDCKGNISDSNKVDLHKEIINVQNQLVFETYYPKSERVIGREYYVHSLCQVCKENLSDSVLCPKCKIIAYCSQDHRREHWPIHADLCAAVVEICKARQVENIMHGAENLSPDDFRTFRYRNMIECELQVERPLEKWEREMFIFPNVCGTCREYNLKKLIVCNRCSHSSYCEIHQTNSHQTWCGQLLLYKNIVKHQAKSGVDCPSVPNCNIPPALPKLLSMDHVFTGIKNCISEYEFFELTDIVSYPLTAIHALFLFKSNKLLNSEHLTLHIVGAESEFEINKLEKWEYYILHLIPELKSLHIEFIGPEINVSSKPRHHEVCKQCTKRNKTIQFNFHNDLYHTVCNNSNVSKPNLICVFNPGLYRMTGFSGQDTWSPSIKAMLGQNCYMLITAYTYKEILMDVDTLKSTENIYLEIEPTPNPFSSLKPSLNFVSDEDSPVIFKNHFYCVICKA